MLALKNYKIILGSGSSRRKKLLSNLGLKFSIKLSKEKEIYPIDLGHEKVAEFLAKQKSESIFPNLIGNCLLITADTIVCQKNHILHKPINKTEAMNTLKQISGTTNKVITGLCIKTNKKEEIFSVKTLVYFNHLSIEEINYYVDIHKPYDKAGAYGIQDWIGAIGVQKINGSYNNVVGLPTAELYQKLKLFI